jgi:uncharacterized protein YndB with AHSA1/START domain
VEIVHELIVRVSPEKAFQALTEAVELASWFAADIVAEPIVGSVAEFRFDQGIIRVEVTALESERKVAWKVLQGLSSWPDDGEIVWDIKTNPFGEGTMIHFRHSGWVTMEDAYPSVNFKWAWFIAKMKSYVETGVIPPSH